MGNIKFHYLYRDGSNYKKWADIVFSNADDLPTETVTRGLREAFLEDGIFIAHQVDIPEVFLASEDQLTPDDHCFHEFDSVATTSDAPNDPRGRSIREFMAEVAKEARHGWRAFDPQDRLLQRGWQIRPPTFL
jgi:hypothetical protein